MIAQWERQYLSVLRNLLGQAERGEWKGNRTGVRTVGEFGTQLEVPLISQKLPALVTKTVHLKSVVAELLWFLKGESNVAYLRENGCTIWDEWAVEDGELGPVYGVQWRNWMGTGQLIDQIEKLILDMKIRPNSRRMIVSAWNPAVLPDESISPQENVRRGLQALAPCHMLFQVYISDLSLTDRIGMAIKMDVPEAVVAALHAALPAEAHQIMDTYQVPSRGLDLRVDQRSADWFLGVPFNIASYALLAHLLCRMVGNLVPRRLVMQFGDYHLYENQQEAAAEQLSRLSHTLQGEGRVKEEELSYPSVRLLGDEWPDLCIIEPDNVELTGYRPWGRIVAPVAV